MNKMIYIPDAEAPAVIKAAKKLDMGVGAYLVKLHKESEARKDDGK
jgi:hypothetical protein